MKEINSLDDLLQKFFNDKEFIEGSLGEFISICNYKLLLNFFFF